MKELTGYAAGFIYSAELSHGLMGYFPLIDKEKDEPVCFSDFDILKKALKTAKPKEFDIQKMAVFIKGNNAVLIQDQKHHKLSITKNIDGITFIWATGLLSLKGNPTEDQYISSIDNLEP